MSANCLGVLAAIGLHSTALASTGPSPDDLRRPDDGCTLHGMVQAGSVRGVQVTISSEHPDDAPLLVAAVDADGGFEAHASGRGTYRVSAAGPALVPTHTLVSCDGEPIDLVLVPGAAPIEITVRGDDSVPVQGAMLVLSTVGKADVDPDPIVLSVPSDGIAFGLERGRSYRLAVTAPGHAPDVTEFVSDDADNLRFQFFLPRLDVIAGSVRRPTGEVVEDATVVRAPTERQPTPALVHTDADGTFVMTVDPDDLCTLVARVDDQVAMVDIVPGSQAELELVLGPGEIMEGRLQDEVGQGVEGRVRWRHLETGLMGETTADVDGRFHVGGLPSDGTIEVWASEGSYDPVRTQAGPGVVVVPFKAPVLGPRMIKAD